MTAYERHSEHEAVGAYALGVLDAADAARFEDHLAYCEPCAQQLDEFMGLEPLLAKLAETPSAVPDPATLHAKPTPQLLDRLVDEVAVRRTQRRRRGLYLVAAAAALIIGGPVIATAVTAENTGSNVALPHAHSTSPAEDAFFNHMTDKVNGTDPGTKIAATVGTEKKAWGTHTVLELKNVKGPERCNLIAVSKSGEEEVITSWSVPRWGYGIPGSKHEAGKKPLYVHGGAAMSRDDIDHFEVRTFSGKRLVSINA
ncbi:zf-HC2 domain-containing protein [Streptomyces sp. NPDC001922]|uniref:zf-HC2 domain-containing protein n=1 Tax=Streptomyces sp. NPDC001922 TaxID=3364624 RepID=UPI0036BBAC6E